MNPTQNAFTILGIPEGSDEQTIKRVYRKLALQYHPDKNNGDLEATEKFKEISNAYEQLLSSKPEEIKAEDLFNNYFPQGNNNTANEQSIFTNFVFHFANTFVNRVNEIAGILPLTLEEVYNGTTKQVTINSGEVNITKEIVISPRFDKLFIHSAIDDNTLLTLNIQFIDHPVYILEYPNINVTLPLTLKEALIGFRKEIPYLTGSNIILESSHVITEKCKIVEGLGLTVNSNLIIKYNISYPEELTDIQKKVIEEYL